jgi:ferredoxin
MSVRVEKRRDVGVRVERSLLPELARFGAVDVAACFNCGNCSAVCPLSPDDGAFPRRLIRYAQLGMREELLSSHELWTCYGCAECTTTCPRQADPAEFMAAARRYAVASYDRTGLARRLATSKGFTVGFLGALVALLAGFLYTAHNPVSGTRLALFQFIPVGFIHDLGIGVFVAFGLAAAAGLFQMVRRVFRIPPGFRPATDNPVAPDGETAPGQRRLSRGRIGDAVWYAVGRESLGQTRYRKECTEEEANEPAGRPWYLRKWFVHAATMWGFLGLLAATILDYGLALIGIKPTGEAVPIWYPVRLLGTVAGLLLVYGTTVAIVRRVRRSDRSSAKSTVSDWSFLSMLWLAGVTGFAIELALYLPKAPEWGYALFLVHVAVAMALVLLAPFGKFAHAIYRPVALAAYRLRSRERGMSS